MVPQAGRILGASNFFFYEKEFFLSIEKDLNSNIILFFIKIYTKFIIQILKILKNDSI